MKTHRKKHHKKGFLLAVIIIVAVFVALTRGAVPRYYEEGEGLNGNDIQADLVSLLESNPETESFVLNYPR